MKLIDFSECESLKSITVDRTATGNPFYGVSDKTMIYLPSRPGVAAAQGQKNVVIGNTATELAFTDGYDFVPQKDFTIPSATFDRVLHADKGYTATIANYDLYDAQKPAYTLQSDGWWYKVPQNEPQAYVGPFRAYFQSTGASSAPSLVTMFGDSYNPDEGSGPDAIEPVVRTIDADGTERYFDLNGCLLPGKPENGIYILNGKKYHNKSRSQ